MPKEFKVYKKIWQDYTYISPSVRAAASTAAFTAPHPSKCGMTYVDALCREMELRPSQRHWATMKTSETIYLGGGTPQPADRTTKLIRLFECHQGGLIFKADSRMPEGKSFLLKKGMKLLPEMEITDGMQPR